MVTHSSVLAWRIPMDRGAWRATVHRVTKSWTQLKQLSSNSNRELRSHILHGKQKKVKPASFPCSLKSFWDLLERLALLCSVQLSSIQLLSHVQLIATP